MQFSIITALTVLLASSVSAYKNNCDGSSKSPDINDCQSAIRNIDPRATYSDGAQFSVGTCYIVYATNGKGAQSLSGQTVLNTAQSILNSCGHHHGSFGTNNCNECHVTVNYRRNP